MENKDCILITKKEYRELIAYKQNGSIRIQNGYDPCYSDFNDYSRDIDIHFYVAFHDIDLSDGLWRKINKIISLISKSLTDKYGELYKSLYKERDKIKEEIYKEIANMSYWERRKFLKQWKQK